MKPGMKYMTLTKKNFQRLVLDSPEPVLVDFWGQDCPPCDDVSPVIRQLAADFHGIARVGKVDVDKNPELVERFDVTSIPTLLFFRNGIVVDRLVGSTEREVLVNKLDSLIMN